IGDIWGWFSDTVIDIGEGIADNPIASLIFLSIVGFILIILWFFLTESGILSAIFRPIIRGFRAIWRAPVSIWNGITKRYASANHYLAGIVLGHDRLENLSQRYWQKVLLFTTLLAIYTFVVGVILTISYSEGWETWEIALYFSLVLFICGVVGGVIELGLLSRILGVLSKDKYQVNLPP
ncbi:MAG: hypothetical protein ACFFCQ_18730, partial [Promethearchaeota archaeon]